MLIYNVIKEFKLTFPLTRPVEASTLRCRALLAVVTLSGTQKLQLIRREDRNLEASLGYSVQ